MVDPLLLLTNGDAGPTGVAALDRALEVLRAATDVEVATTSTPGELDGVLHRAGSRRLVVAGGDGGLHAVVSALHRRHDLAETVLGLIPLGTGNDFARGAGIPLDPESSAHLVLGGTPRGVDLMVDCVGEVVINHVHVGAGAEASRHGARWKRLLGRVGYPVGAAITAVSPPYLRLRVTVDDAVAVDLDRPVLQVAVGNGSHVGGGTELTPRADPSDGEVDVMISYALGTWDRLGYVTHLHRGRHHRRTDVRYLRGSTVSVSGEPFHCSADGEIYGPERNRTWRVEPGAVTMVLPEAAEPTS